MRERTKYERCWNLPAYRKYSPGEEALPVFKQLVRKRGSLIDIGCGSGRASLALSKAGYDVTQLDFAGNARDKEVREANLPFLRQSILDLEGEWDYGYCCDVMEHLPPSQTLKALKKILKSCRRVFFGIHFGPDNFGQVVGHPLHLQVQEFTWWRDTLRKLTTVHDARDMMGIGAFYVGR